jgi:hypothetical protein
VGTSDRGLKNVNSEVNAVGAGVVGVSLGASAWTKTGALMF